MTQDKETEEWMNAPMGKLKTLTPMEAIIDSQIRINCLEEELDKLTDVVKAMSDFIRVSGVNERIFTASQTGNIYDSSKM